HLEKLWRETKARVPGGAEKPGPRSLRIGVRINRVAARARPDRAVPGHHTRIRLRNAAVDEVEELASRLLGGREQVVEGSIGVRWVDDWEDEVGECLHSAVWKERISPQRVREAGLELLEGGAFVEGAGVGLCSRRFVASGGIPPPVH